MKQFLLFLLFASCALQTVTDQVWAKTFTGRLDKSNGHYYLVKNNTKFELQFNSNDLEASVKKLQVKDYLSVEGDLVPYPNKNRTQKLKIFEINFVGLDELVGLWRAQDGTCYFFSGFTRVLVFYPNAEVQCNYTSLSRLNLAAPVTYSYFINPSEDETWNMLLSSDSAQFFGELVDLYFSSSVKKIKFYSATSGDLLLEHVIRKVAQ